MIADRYSRRLRTNNIAMGLSIAAAAVGLVFLALILATLLWKGVGGLSWQVFAETTPPPGSAGGLANAIAGSIVMTAIGLIVGTPIGVLAGTYMAEYGRYSKLTHVVRFLNDILLSAPSIIVGLLTSGSAKAKADMQPRSNGEFAAGVDLVKLCPELIAINPRRVICNYTPIDVVTLVRQ